MNEATYNLLLIPLFPLIGAMINLLFGGALIRNFGRSIGKEIVHLVAIGAVAFSCFFTFSVVLKSGLLHFPSGHVADGLKSAVTLRQVVYPWITSGGTTVNLSFTMDELSGVMCMVVTGVGLLIHIFSLGYMAHDPGYHRYFGYLNLFMASMLILVLGSSLAVTFVGWEGVGLCSYLLIGFWFTDEAKATAGRKAFIVNRIGDFGFLLGMLAIFGVVGSLEYADIASVACQYDVATAACRPELSPFAGPMFGVASVATVATLLLFVGCTGKSAQIPLFVWLPDAMAGPTPVSALIHAATMVTAGVYLCVRLNFLLALAPVVMAVIAVVGALTAVFAATIGITQNDIKKVLAYSTVSQLGYMFLAVGLGAWGAAIFHLVTHAFFKACLFLGSGAVIDACHHNQDIRTMGGLRKKMPVTAATFLVSCLAISGVPLFAGFFSKDEILLRAYVNVTVGVFSPGDAVLNYVLYSAGILAAACTAFYMFRVYYLTFEGEFRGDQHTWTKHVREQWIMSGPLVVLAVLAAFGGFLGYPHVFPGSATLPHLFNWWLSPILAMTDTYGGQYFVGLRGVGLDSDGTLIPAWFSHGGHVSAAAEFSLMAISVAVAASAIWFARALYRRGPSKAAEAWAHRFGAFYRASLNKYWIDELYHRTIVRPVRFVAGALYNVVDQLFVDRVGVGGVARGVGALGHAARVWHNGNVRRYLVLLLVGAAVVLASVFANPHVVQVGPDEVHPIDAGGLRTRLGCQRIRVEIWGLGEKIFECEGDPPARRRHEPGDIRPSAVRPTQGREVNGGAP